MSNLNCHLMLMGAELLLREVQNKLRLWIFLRNGEIKPTE